MIERDDNDEPASSSIIIIQSLNYLCICTDNDERRLNHAASAIVVVQLLRQTVGDRLKRKTFAAAAATVNDFEEFLDDCTCDRQVKSSAIVMIECVYWV